MKLGCFLNKSDLCYYYENYQSGVYQPIQSRCCIFFLIFPCLQICHIYVTDISKNVIRSKLFLIRYSIFIRVFNTKSVAVGKQILITFKIKIAFGEAFNFYVVCLIISVFIIFKYQFKLMDKF